jgi:hypothetical protein
MKRNLYTIMLMFVVLNIANAHTEQQEPCPPNGVTTNPDAPINDEFLPMSNGWNGTNHTVNPFLNSGFNWYSQIRQIKELILRVIDLQEQINKIKE